MNLEDILAYKAREQEAENASLLNAGITVGAGGGALAGMLMGQPVHSMGSALAKRQGASAKRQPMKAFKPGARMAGGLLGLMSGGGLGAAVATATRQENAAAEILGKVMAGGELDRVDKMVLENQVADFYKGLA